MTADTQEQATRGGRPAYIWWLAAVGVGLAFIGVLVCGLSAGFGFLMLTRAEKAASAEAVENLDAQAVEADRPEEKPVEAKPAAPKLGNPAPGFTLTNLQGESVSLADYEGQPVLLNFWATWCGPCEAEMPEINQAYLDFQDEGFVVLAVNLQEHPDTVQSFVDYYELDFPILLDRQEEVSRQYQARALPTSYFVDRSGNIVHAYYGQMDEKALRIGLRKIMPDVDELQIQPDQ
jgi:peroxiredoxin